MATEDFSLYHDLLQALRRRGLEVVTLAFGDEVPPGVGVILTGWKDFAAGKIGLTASSRTGRPVPVVSIPLDRRGREDYEAAINEALKVLAGVSQFRAVTVGIDPGDRPGLAVVGDGTVLHTQQLEQPSEVVEAARRGVGQYPAERHVIRVGHGARLVRNRILNDLLALRDMGVDVEIVDETASNPSPASGRRLVSEGESRHVQAAVRIALARGERVQGLLPVEPSEGEVADVQRVSRIASQGKVTISKQRARKVARGELGLEEAIRAQEKQLERK